MSLKCTKLLFCFLVISCNSQLENLNSRLPLLGIARDGEFDRPTVLLISPFTNQREVNSKSNIELTFSQPMDKVRTEQGINISGGEANVRYNWRSDFFLEILFRSEMNVGKKYEVRLDKNLVKDARGNFLAENYLSYFYTTGIEPFPFVLSSDPPKTDSVSYNWPVDKNISITFSEPMDEVKTNAAISVSGGPALFIKTWNPESTVLTLVLQSPLSIPTLYTLRVNTSATNKKGLRLDADYIVLFSTGISLTFPDVSVTATPLSNVWPSFIGEPAINSVNGVSKSDRIQFSFTEAMNQTATQNSISFNPPIDGQFNWISPTLLQFIPNSLLTANQTYRLTITKSAVNASGYPLANSYVIDFLVDNPNDSGSITLQNITGYSVNGACVNSVDSNPNVSSIPLNTSNVYSASVTSTGCALKDYVFELTFATANGCALKSSGQGDIFDQVSISYYSGGPITTPNIYLKSYSPPAVCSANTPYQFALKNLPLGVQYKITVKGGTSGLLDINGNTLPNDIYFIFQRL